MKEGERREEEEKTRTLVYLYVSLGLSFYYSFACLLAVLCVCLSVTLFTGLFVVGSSCLGLVSLFRSFPCQLALSSPLPTRIGHKEKK